MRADREAREAAAAAVAAARDLAEAELVAVRREMDVREQRLGGWEQRLVERTDRLDAEARRLEAREHDQAQREASLNRLKVEIADIEEERRLTLERVAGLTAGEAKAELVATMEHQAKRDAAILVRDIENEARTNGEDRARRIVTLAIQRVASEQTAESVVSVLHLPSDDMKGRIIGREGRNIRAFESLTGVNVIIDDTPEAVLLSCFDPVRREMGRLTPGVAGAGRPHPSAPHRRAVRAGQVRGRSAVRSSG